MNRTGPYIPLLKAYRDDLLPNKIVHVLYPAFRALCIQPSPHPLSAPCLGEKVLPYSQDILLFSQPTQGLPIP